MSSKRACQAATALLELRRAPRGRYAVVEAEVVLEDYLGLERVVVPAGPAQPVLVYPRLPELDGLFSDTARLGAGQRYLPLRASGFDFHSVREYEQGESLRKVHWPTTARRGRLMVKELRESPREDLVVLLQCDAAATVGPRGDSSFDAQVRAAGAFLRTVVARGRRAALVLGTQRMEMLRVTSLDGDWDAAFAALAGVEPDGDRPLERLLEDPAVGAGGGARPRRRLARGACRGAAADDRRTPPLVGRPRRRGELRRPAERAASSAAAPGSGGSPCRRDPSWGRPFQRARGGAGRGA